MARSIDRLQVCVVFGGCSEEHPISVKSAVEVAKHLDPDRYEPHFVGITERGEWKLCDGPDGRWEEGDCRPAFVSPDRSVHGLVVLAGGTHETIRLDVVVPVLHGKHGEDGAMQGLLELAGIPYAGCDIASSALCMDKSLAYVVAKHAGIATPTFSIIRPDETFAPHWFSYPAFVKPARSGSSFGVTKVEREDDLLAAIEVARRFDSKVLIEEAVVGTEVGCAVLGHGTDLLVGELDQITLSGGLFRIHQEDHPEQGSANSTITVPAPLPADVRLVVREKAKAVYRALGCRGLARVDLFLTDQGQVVLNEVNTLPGLTTYSRYPAMMAAAGLPLTEVLDRLIALAIDGDRR